MSKTVLVIGGSHGIGLSIVRNLVAQGINVIAASRNPIEIQGVTNITLDVTTSDFSILEQLTEPINGVVYAPGSINLKPFHRLSTEDFQRDFEVNVLGAVKTLQAVLKNLKKSEGGASVVLFSTVAAKLGMGFHASIATSKSGLEGLAKSLAAEWAPQKIRVNVIAPSLTDTPLASNLLDTPEKREASAKRHPLGAVGNPDDLAALATFLLSDQAKWITGQIIGADGGIGSLK